MAFSGKIRHARLLKRLTIEETARALGISPRTYSAYERGEREPTFSKALEILRFLKSLGVHRGAL